MREKRNSNKKLFNVTGKEIWDAAPLSIHSEKKKKRVENIFTDSASKLNQYSSNNTNFNNKFNNNYQMSNIDSILNNQAKTTKYSNSNNFVKKPIDSSNYLNRFSSSNSNTKQNDATYSFLKQFKNESPKKENDFFNLNNTSETSKLRRLSQQQNNNIETYSNNP